MTVEIPREEVKEIKLKWGLYTAIFRSSFPGEIELQPSNVTLGVLQADIKRDPDGFLAFAQAIYDEAYCNNEWAASPPEKKPRKERKDKGSKKGVQIIPGISTGEDCLTIGTRKPRLHINTLKDSYTITYGDKKEKGFLLKNTLDNLKTSLGGSWPSDMHPDDLKLVKEIEIE